MQRNLSHTLAALGAALLLGGCGTQLDEARAAFGYSGLAAGDPALSSYEQAKADFAAARYGLAIKRFQMAVAEDPASIEAVNGLAASYDQLGRYDLAERYYRRALVMDPNSVQTLNNLGYSLMLQGKHDMALAFFRDAARVDPDNAIIATNAGRAVAARMADQSEQLAASPAELAAPASTSPAATPATPAGPRIVRLSAGEQALLLEPQSQPVARTVPLPPAVPAVPLTPVDTQPLPPLAPLPQPRNGEAVVETVALRPTVRVAATAEPDTLLPAGPSETPAAAVDFAASVELANGNGRRHMAARMKAYLAELGLSAMRLRNADKFTYGATVITYRPGHRRLAEAVSAALPVAASLQQVSEQDAAVRVQLGGDLLEFDRALLQAERNTSHADAV